MIFTKILQKNYSNFEILRLMKDELDRKIMMKFVWLTAKSYSYLIDDGSKDKKAKGTKMGVIKKKLEFENYQKCLEATQLDNKIDYLEKITQQFMLFKNL